VLDGDALQSEIVTAHYAGSRSEKVLTPHAGEFARIAGSSATDDAALRAIAVRLSATVVLKGAPTRIGGSAVLQPAPGSDDSERGPKHRATFDPVYYSPFGGPVLSRGGSGDVLAGLIAGQLAQGVGALEAAARGVVWHSRAADRLACTAGEVSTRVTELIPHLAAVLRERTDVAGGASPEPVERGDPGPASPRPATTQNKQPA
jgi:NAD(P)H-hydrate epimerase